MIKGIRHIGIATNNMKKMLAFYISLGFVPTTKTTDPPEKIADLTGRHTAVTSHKLEAVDGTILELLEFDTSKYRLPQSNFFMCGITHIAFTVTDIEVMCKKIKKQGGTIISKQIVTDKAGRKIVFCQDIEGNILELVEE